MTPIIIGQSVCGDSHIRHGVPRQDNFLIIDGIHSHDRNMDHFYNDLPEDVKIVAVADGHGSDSCPYSKTGSQTAVNVFCDIMAEYAVKFKDSRDDLFVALKRDGDTTISQTIVGEWGRRILKHDRMMAARGIIERLPEKSDDQAIWKEYGTTLLGMLITKDFTFAFQLGDGDITYVDKDRVSPVIEGDKILGVETHSISKPDSWKKVITQVIKLDDNIENPFMYILSTDGWLNSHASELDFQKTCKDYFSVIQEQGAEVVENNLERWLSETSALGCGDDITTVFVYFY